MGNGQRDRGASDRLKPEPVRGLMECQSVTTDSRRRTPDEPDHAENAGTEGTSAGAAGHADRPDRGSDAGHLGRDEPDPGGRVRAVPEDQELPLAPERPALPRLPPDVRRT